MISRGREEGADIRACRGGGGGGGGGEIGWWLGGGHVWQGKFSARL